MKSKSALALLAMTFGLVACETTESTGDFSCDVTRSGSTVILDERLSGSASYISKVTAQVDDYGYDYVSVETELWYANSAYASEECSERKDDARGWKDGSVDVTCSGNYINIYEYDEGSLDDYERDFNRQCEEAYRRYESGDLQL